MKDHSFSESSTQLLITNWDVTHEVDAFEGNQIQYVQGCFEKCARVSAGKHLISGRYHRSHPTDGLLFSV